LPAQWRWAKKKEEEEEDEEQEEFAQRSKEEN
jgi:hypothetical protein